MVSPTPNASPSPAKPRSLTPMFWIVALCLAPVVFALLAYYVPALGLRPEGSKNYGQLVNPQRPVPATESLGLTTLDGQPFDLASLKGKWVLMTADQGACPESCVEKLFILRNSHAAQGKNVERVTRVWFITDDAQVPQVVQDAYIGTIMLRANPEKLAAYLTANTVSKPGATPAETLAQPMWVVDPLGNLMLEFPPDDGTAPEERGPKVRKDLSKLIYHSRIG